MDALGDYGSDSDASSSSLSQGAPPQQVGGIVPAHVGPSGWIHGNQNHLKSCLLPLVPSSSSSVSTTPALAQTLRAQHEFGNPQHLETTVATLGISNAFGSNVAPEFAEWELQQLAALEEEARAQVAVTNSVPASDFVQNQLSRALAGGGTRE